MTAVRLVPLPTAFDPHDSPLTLATPSCCCCCCCCLNTITGVAAFSTAHAVTAATTTQKSAMGAGLLGLLTVPAAFLGAWLGARAGGDAPVVVTLAALSLLAMSWASLRVAGVRGWPSITPGLLTVGIGGALLTAEFFLTLVTVFIIQLLFPFAIWLGVVLGRRATDSHLGHRPSPPATPPPPQGPPSLPPPPGSSGPDRPSDEPPQP